jgi:hypothetical protein
MPQDTAHAALFDLEHAPCAFLALPAPKHTNTDGAESIKPMYEEICCMLREHPPGRRPAHVVSQLSRWLVLLPYFEPRARRAALPIICQWVSLRVARAGDLLLRQGDIGSSAMLLLSGRASLHTATLRHTSPMRSAPVPDDIQVDVSASMIAPVEAEVPAAHAPVVPRSLLATSLLASFKFRSLSKSSSMPTGQRGGSHREHADRAQRSTSASKRVEPEM